MLLVYLQVWAAAAAVVVVTLSLVAVIRQESNPHRPVIGRMVVHPSSRPSVVMNVTVMGGVLITPAASVVNVNHPSLAMENNVLEQVCYCWSYSSFNGTPHTGESSL